MFPPRSLQNRLLLSFLVSMTAILALGGFVIYTVIGRHLASENDDLLRDRLLFYETVYRLEKAFFLAPMPPGGWRSCRRFAP